MTISTFLWMSIDATLSLSAIVSSWRGSGRTRGKIHYAPSRATTLPAGRGGATKIGSKHAFRVKLLHGLNSSRAATTFTVPRRIHNTTSARADFRPYWWAEGPSNTPSELNSSTNLLTRGNDQFMSAHLSLHPTPPHCCALGVVALQSPQLAAQEFAPRRPRLYRCLVAREPRRCATPDQHPRRRRARTPQG